MSPPLIGTALDGSGPTSHSGFIDLIDGVQGVRGWAVNLANPSEPVLLQLCIGPHLVAETFASTEREDISAQLGRPTRAGFAFDASVMLTLSDFLEDPTHTLAVRIASTGHLLSSAEAPKTGGELIASQQADSAPAVDDAGSDLRLLLEQLRASATHMAGQPLRPSPEGLQGYVETLAVDPAGQVWFMGWTRRGHVQEFSAVVQERRRHPAAIAVMSYARDDLPSDCCGVVGLIASDWRPSSASSELLVFFGAGGRFHLRSHDPLRIITSGELLAEYEGIRDRCLGDGRVTVLQRMMAASDVWVSTRGSDNWYATETSIDCVVLVPGLGCLAEGWVLSPVKRVAGLRLRVGGAVMTARPEALYWKARPDLLDAFPGSERLVRRAGFVGLFAGGAEPQDFAEPVLKVVFEGGDSANFPVAARAFRRLGHSASVEDAQKFFPALQDEAFFPAFAEAAIRAERASMNPPVPISIAPSRRVLVAVLPADRCDMFLLFEELAQQCRAGLGLEALAFVASAQANRSDALWLFREFQAVHGAVHGVVSSLLVVDDADQVFDLLPPILRELGASRFMFMAGGVFLKPAGWTRVSQALAQGATDLVFFGAEADGFERRTPADGATARCFAWSTGHFARWARTAPAFMGGFHKDNGLMRADAPKTVHPDATFLTRSLRPNRITEAVNEAVYARYAHAQAGSA